MIQVERKRQFAASVAQVQAILSDIDQLDRLIHRAERVEVLARNENRARVALTMRIGRIPPQQIEGEARLLSDGVRFVAVRPMQIDARYVVHERSDSTEVIAQLATEIPRALVPFARFVPQRLIDERIARELDASLDALDAILAEQHGLPPH